MEVVGSRSSEAILAKGECNRYCCGSVAIVYGVVLHVEDLFRLDLSDASQRVCAEVLPDIAAALDRVLPLVAHGDRMAVRRYISYVDDAAMTLTALPATDPGELPPSIVVYSMLRQDAAGLRWVAPSSDGIGILTVLVDRLRGFAGGLPQVCGQATRDVDMHHFRWFVKEVAESNHEREQASPLRRAMETFDLTGSAMADLMGVKRQAVDKWLLAGPPPDRAPKIAAIAEIGDILRHRLREGLPIAVVRRPADAYGGRTMLEVIAADEHEWLLRSVRDSFDFRQVA
jgi:DNA-binding transcriptional regulator YdaS (Cro superfamily)